MPEKGAQLKGIGVCYRVQEIWMCWGRCIGGFCAELVGPWVLVWWCNFTEKWNEGWNNQILFLKYAEVNVTDVEVNVKTKNWNSKLLKILSSENLTFKLKC